MSDCWIGWESSIHNNLLQCCKDLYEWKQTGFLNQEGQLKSIAELIQSDINCSSTHALAVAQELILTAALKQVINSENCCQGGPQWGHAWDCPKLP